MGQTKIRGFRGLRDGKEDPNEYLEDIEWAYEQDYESREPDSQDGKAHYYNKTHRILFRQHLQDDAFAWYSELDSELKQNWTALRQAFLPAYAITIKDSQTKKFELRIKLANLQQGEHENIADYLKRAGELSLKLPQEDIDVGMATLKGMHDVGKRERISFECNKDADYSYANVLRLIKAAYSEIGKTNPFDPNYKDSLKLTLPGASALTNEELMRQVLINTNQAFPALVQGMRSLQTTFAQRSTRPANQAQVEGKPYQARQSDQPRPKRDLSEIECFVCGQKGHYASLHNQASPPVITAGVTASEQYQQYHDPREEQEEESPVATRCLFIDDEEATNAMAATNPKQQAGANKPQQILQRPKGIQKSQPKGKDFNPPELPKHILDQIREYNEGYAGNPQVTDENREVEEMDEEEDKSPQTLPNTAPQPRHPLQPAMGAANRPPQTRVTKTGKVQELVAQKGPKVPDPIRGMANESRFNVKQILNLPVQLSLGELLDRSDTTIKELAYAMQRATPRYRIRKQAAGTHGNQGGVQGSAIMAASALLPPDVTARAYEDDGQSKPVMITSWIKALKLVKTLLDGGSLVELLGRKKLNQMHPRPKVYTDGHLRVSLATDKLDTLTDYVKIPVNVEGVEALIKAWIVDVEIYDLLLGLSWMRRVHCNPHYGSGTVTISGDDMKLRQVQAQLAPMDTGLPVVEFDEEDESADLACQHLLDEQEKGWP